jgi:Zn-dependent M28 family amino/carboxypeptidase
MGEAGAGTPTERLSMARSRRHQLRSLSTRVITVTAASVLLLALVPGGGAQAAPGNACDTQTNNTYQKLLQCVSADGAFEHLQALQEIADANEDPFYPGTRAAGTDGYDDSVDYVVRTLEQAGWNVTLDPVSITFNFPPVLRQLTPVAATYETGVYTGSGSGNVTGNVIPVDLALAPPRNSSSGCEASDFGGLDFSGPNDIALIQRGTCNFSVKAVNAQAAGAEAVVIFNQGNSPDREGVNVGTAAVLPDGSPSNLTIPVVGASFADGVALAQPGSTANVNVQPAETRTDYNVLAELPGTNKDNVVMAGAHLDSVIAGPGINDNGTGSAALLDLAQALGKVKPENTLRFGWWAGEEQGLVGSRDYVLGLSQAERDKIAAYVNFDMVGSPNFVYFVYDADESSFPAPAGVPIPEGSEALEDLFEIYYTWKGIPYEDTEFSGRSDYQEFINNGIPASGLFTGAEGVKTAAQEAIWGGTAGDQYDPCYHLACDTIDNPSAEAVGVNVDAIAFSVLSLAYSTEEVNGVKGKMVPGSPALKLPTEPAGPEGTVGSGGGGGLHHDHHEVK